MLFVHWVARNRQVSHASRLAHMSRATNTCAPTACFVRVGVCTAWSLNLSYRPCPDCRAATGSFQQLELLVMATPVLLAGRRHSCWLRTWLGRAKAGALDECARWVFWTSAVRATRGACMQHQTPCQAPRADCLAPLPALAHRGVQGWFRLVPRACGAAAWTCGCLLYRVIILARTLRTVVHVVGKASPMCVQVPMYSHVARAFTIPSVAQVHGARGGQGVASPLCTPVPVY